jgi:hypothetical protein
MLWWFGNSGAAIAVVLGGWIVGLVLFRRFRPDDIKKWRIVNYLILAFGAVGLWGFLIDSSTEVARRHLEIERPRYEETLASLKHHFRFYGTYLCDRVYQRTEYSPSDLDEIRTLEYRIAKIAIFKLSI